MDANTQGQIVLAGVGLVAAAASTVTAFIGKRILTKTDDLTTTVGEHTVQLAEFKLKLPNGEWRAIKDSVAQVQTDVTAVHGEVREVRGELAKHILDETTALADTRAVVATCKGLLTRQAREKKRGARR